MFRLLRIRGKSIQISRPTRNQPNVRNEDALAALSHRTCTIFLKENTPETDFKNFQSGKNQ